MWMALVGLLMGVACTAHEQGHDYAFVWADKLQTAVLLLGGATVMMFAPLPLAARLAVAGILGLVGLGNLRQADAWYAIEVTRHSVEEVVRRALAEECAQTTRAIERQAKGNERIQFRTQGAELVPEWQTRHILPSNPRLGDGVVAATDQLKSTEATILLDIVYGRERVPGSTSDYEFERTKVDVKVMALPGRELLSHTTDVQTLEGFCLGGIEQFLQKALNRPGVLRTDGASDASAQRELGLADAYVRAEYSATTSGEYLVSDKPRHSLGAMKSSLVSLRCRVKDELQAPVALCGESGRQPVELPLGNLEAMHKLPNGWLLVYREAKGWKQLTSLRIEQRGSDWQLVRAWVGTARPRTAIDASDAMSPRFSSQEFLDGLEVKGDVMTVGVHWAMQWQHKTPKYWFRNRAVLKVPLPGLVR